MTGGGDRGDAATPPAWRSYLERPDMLLVLQADSSLSNQAAGVGADDDALAADGEPSAHRPLHPSAVAALYLAMDADGAVVAFNGHVDLGTGIGTALTQIVAEELDVPVACVTMVLGDTQAAPDQGATIASETIQVTAIPLAACRGLRSALPGRPGSRNPQASRRQELRVVDGVILAREDDIGRQRPIQTGSRPGPIGESRSATSIRGRHDRLCRSTTTVPLKPVSGYRDRRSIRCPGSTFRRKPRARGPMCMTSVCPEWPTAVSSGRPYAGIDAGPHVGTSLDRGRRERPWRTCQASIAIVVIRRFRRRRGRAGGACGPGRTRQLKVTWKPAPFAARSRRARRCSAAGQSGDSPPAAGPRQRRAGSSPATRDADGPHLRLALPDAWFDRPLLFGGGLPRGGSAGGLVGDPESRPSVASRFGAPRSISRRRPSSSIGWRRPAATAATVPTMSARMPRCFHERSAARSGSSSRASRSMPGSPRARPRSWTCAAASIREGGPGCL